MENSDIGQLNFNFNIIGRKNELETLLEYLNKTKKGEGNTLFISGEAGIGKSRLINELKHIAQEKGFKFLLGNSYYESLNII